MSRNIRVDLPVSAISPVAGEAGLDLRGTPRATLGVAYSGQYASSIQENSVKGRFAWKF
jgi:uncharacterized protein with beta-barrel porin domain